jgi:hypothetical protein
MRANFVVFESDEGLRDLQGDFKEVIDPGVVAAFGDLLIFDFLANDGVGFGKTTISLKAFGAVLASSPVYLSVQRLLRVRI